MRFFHEMTYAGGRSLNPFNARVDHLSDSLIKLYADLMKHTSWQLKSEEQAGHWVVMNDLQTLKHLLTGASYVVDCERVIF